MVCMKQPFNVLCPTGGILSCSFLNLWQ